MQFTNVIICGSIAYDEIMDFPGLFEDYFQKERLHQINISFVVDRLDRQLGGIVTNISCNLRFLTKKKITALGAVGRDGDALLRFFKKHKIVTDGILVDRRLYTAGGKVFTDRRDNQIWGYYYGPSKKAATIRLADHAERQSVLILSATAKEAFLSFQKQAIDMGLAYMYDAGMTLTWIAPKELRRGVENCRWLVGNDYEIAKILKVAGVTKGRLMTRGVAIITTLGEEGVCFESDDGKMEIPSFKIKKIVDPTGAGDAWRAGFIAGVVEGKSVKESLIQANALASFAVERYGTVNHRPNSQDINKRIKAIMDSTR